DDAARRREFLETLADAADRAPGADGCHEGLRRLSIQRRQDLLGRALVVHLRVLGVVELVRQERPRDAAAQLLGALDGALHLLLGRGEHELGPVGLQERAALQAHALGHREDAAVAVLTTHERKANAGVPAGWLDHRRARSEQAAAL